MIKINVLIVEDSTDSATKIRLGIDRYNKIPQWSDYQIDVFDAVRSYEEAVLCINSSRADIRLIFLDINLDSAKSGLDIIKEFPNIAYILVSQNHEALDRIVNETKTRPEHYVRKAAESVFTIRDITTAIETFIEGRRESFFEKTIRYDGSEIPVDKYCLISKHPVRVIENGKEIDEFGHSVRRGIYSPMLITVGEATKKREPKKTNDNFYFSENIITTDPVSKGIILSNLHIQETDSSISLTNIVTANNLDPNAFLQVSESNIINTKYVLDYRERDDAVALRLRGSKVFPDGSFETIRAWLRCDSKVYMTTKVKQLLFAKINTL